EVGVLDGMKLLRTDEHTGPELVVFDGGNQRATPFDNLRQRPAVDPRPEVTNLGATIVDDPNGDPTVGLAVVFEDDHLLGDVNQTTGQITRVSSTQSGVGETLAGTVSRDEILEHRQTFTEVGDDRT